MPENSAMNPGRFRKSIVSAVLCCGLSLGAAGHALAQEYTVVNTPPPMPDSMRHSTTVLQAPQGVFPVGAERTATINGQKVRISEAVPGDMGYAVPDVNGNLVWMPAPAKSMKPAQADARELRLKIRELASQLIANMDPSLRGVVAIPTSFVSQEDFTQTSTLGRFIAEQFLYECNQRGFPVREYRLASSVTVTEDGEFMLSRNVSGVSGQTSGAVFVVGTYLIDKQVVFINARLVRGNGTVLRTAQVILPGTGVTRRMLAGSGKAIKSGTLPIRDFRTTTQPVNLTPFDHGEDIH